MGFTPHIFNPEGVEHYDEAVEFHDISNSTYSEAMTHLAADGWDFQRMFREHPARHERLRAWIQQLKAGIDAEFLSSGDCDVDSMYSRTATGACYGHFLKKFFIGIGSPFQGTDPRTCFVWDLTEITEIFPSANATGLVIFSVGRHPPLRGMYYTRTLSGRSRVPQTRHEYETAYEQFGNPLLYDVACSWE